MEKSTCVYEASGEVDAQQVRDFLEANGITCSFHGESLRKTHGLTIDGLGLVAIHVRETDADRARELLAAADRGDFSLDEDLLGE
ncbi:MAG: putative signal transducing protein [Vicinamibacteria bacterium]